MSADILEVVEEVGEVKLDQCNISASSSLIQVTYRNLDGKLFTFERLLSGTSAASLMLEIEQKEGIPPSQQRITHCGKDLREMDIPALFGGVPDNQIQFASSPTTSDRALAVNELQVSLALRIRGGMFGFGKSVKQVHNIHST